MILGKASAHDECDGVGAAPTRAQDVFHCDIEQLPYGAYLTGLPE
jgi:hypothetical protein